MKRLIWVMSTFLLTVILVSVSTYTNPLEAAEAFPTENVQLVIAAVRETPLIRSEEEYPLRLARN